MARQKRASKDSAKTATGRSGPKPAARKPGTAKAAAKSAAKTAMLLKQSKQLQEVKARRQAGPSEAARTSGRVKTPDHVKALQHATPADGAVRRRRPRAAVSHYREEDFVAGTQAGAKYRELGVAAASGGLADAHVVRLIGACDPPQASKLLYHKAEFQLVYVLNGWVKTSTDGDEATMRQGACWTQPPRVKPQILDYSDNCELLQVILPAQSGL